MHFGTRRLLWLCLAAAPALALVASASARSADTAAPYVPGLGEIMAATQMRHLKLWYAGAAQNWPLADYEVDELAEGFADAARYHPHHKDAPRPLPELIPQFTAAPIAALRTAIAAHNPVDFRRVRRAHRRLQRCHARPASLSTSSPARPRTW
jgi:hypothetical protein